MVDWGRDWSPGWTDVNTLVSAGKGLTAEQKRRLEVVKRAPRITSMFERMAVKVEGSERWEWKTLQVGWLRVAKEQVRLAVEGDMGEATTQGAMEQVWRAFELHAKEMGSDDAQRMNIDERPMKPFGQRTRPPVVTLYSGVKKTGSKREPALGEEGQAGGGLQITQEIVAKRVALQTKIDRVSVPTDDLRLCRRLVAT